MISADWTAALLGLAAGVVASAAFFAGLAVGMRRALRSANPVTFLSLSAVLRIAALLGVGWVVVERGGPWAGLGFAGAFFVTRLVATAFARFDATDRGTQ
jgi:F1F0 ATPase subunit 2